MDKTGTLIVGTWESFVKEVEVHSELDYCLDFQNFSGEYKYEMEFQERKIVFSKGIKAENAQVGSSKGKNTELFLPYVQGKCLDEEVEKGQVGNEQTV